MTVLMTISIHGKRFIIIRDKSWNEINKKGIGERMGTDQSVPIFRVWDIFENYIALTLLHIIHINNFMILRIVTNSDKIIFSILIRVYARC